MQFKWHVLFGFIISYLLVYFFNVSLLSGLIIFLSSFLIDIDHYLWYGATMKDWNPLNAITWGLKIEKKWDSTSIETRNKFQRGVFIFHGLPFWILLAVLAYHVNEAFLFVLVGIMIHMAADFPDMIYQKESLYNKIFPCLVIIRNKGKKSLKEF